MAGKRKTRNESCLLGAVLVCLVIIWPTSQYAVFRLRESEVTPLYDQLNEAVLDELPPPVGARVVRISKYGNGFAGDNGTVHGRVLFVVYRGALLRGDVLRHYRVLVDLEDWPDSREVWSLSFRKGAACVSVGYVGADDYTFNVRIHHDFAGQAFSPPLPSTDILRFFELSTTNVLVCR